MQAQSLRILLPFVCYGALVLSACGTRTEPAEVVIALREPSSGSIASATILVDYSQAGAKPAQTGGSPACATIVPNVTADFSDDGQGRLTIHARASQGISTPVDLAVCRMIPDSPGTSADSISGKLRVSVLEGTDTAGAPVSTHGLGQRAARETQEGSASGSGHRDRLARAEGTAHEAGEPAPGEDARQPAEKQPGAPAGGQPGVRTPGAASSAVAPGAGREPASRAGTAPEETPPSEEQPAAADERAGIGGKADANEDSDTDRTARAYEIVVGVTNAAGPLGALQFDIIHSGSSGGFAGAAASARCRVRVSAALATFNDKGRGTLSGALVDLDGIPTPGAIADCTFKSRDAVNAGDFSVRVVDAADVEGKKPKANPQMAVMSITALE